MSVPKIIINGKTFSAPNPKLKLWRKCLKFTQKYSTTDKLDQLVDEEVLDDLEQLICDVFNNSEITIETLEENIDISEFMPLFEGIKTWIENMVNEKAAKLPNG